MLGTTAEEPIVVKRVWSDAITPSGSVHVTPVCKLVLSALVNFPLDPKSTSSVLIIDCTFASVPPTMADKAAACSTTELAAKR